VRDGISLERSGVPAVVISHDVFERAARAQSNALGLSELRLIIYSQPKGEEEELEGAESARQVVSQLVDMVRETDV
jgi:hypothetical protein